MKIRQTIEVPRCGVKKVSQKIFGMPLQNSLVAVMDVMGFSSMLENNSELFNLVQTNVAFESCCKRIKHLASIFNDKGEMRKIQKRMFHFQFSDTLVLVLPLQTKLMELQFAAFIDKVIWTVEAYFEGGFPVQCQIEFGDCLWNNEEYFLLGKPFVDAHVNAGLLDFAGVVMSDKVVEMIKEKIRDLDRVRRIFRVLGVEQISVPIKNNGFQPRYCIDWRYSRYDKKASKIDIRQYLVRKFTEHGKGLSSSVINKLNNTEYLIRQFWECAREFQEEESWYKISPQVKNMAGMAHTRHKRANAK